MKSLFSAVIFMIGFLNMNQAMANDSFRDNRFISSQFKSDDEPALQADEDQEMFHKNRVTVTTVANTTSVTGAAVTFNNPTATGSGCPSGTVGVALTPDKKTLSVVFDSFIAEAGQSSGVKKDIKSCTVNVPMVVPQGLQFTVVKVDYRGYNLVPDKARNRYVTMYSLTDMKNRQISRRVRRDYDFIGPVDDVYTLSSSIKNVIWSPCGKNVNFKIEARAVTSTNKVGEDTMATIDSLDASVGNTKAGYHFLWRQCKNQDRPWFFAR